MSGGSVIRYRHVNAARHDHLLLADGRFAKDVRLWELRPLMGRIGIVVGPAMNKETLLDLYLERIQDAAEELRTPATRPMSSLSQEAMAAAAAFLAKQATA